MKINQPINQVLEELSVFRNLIGVSFLVVALCALLYWIVQVCAVILIGVFAVSVYTGTPMSSYFGF
jgi:hypothetical protein